MVTEVYKFAQEIGAATNEQSHGSSQIAKATTRLNEITHEITSSVEEQAGGAQAVVRAMERMREMVQQSTSSSTELAASAEQMSKMARSLLESMDRFVLEEHHGRAPPAERIRSTRWRERIARGLENRMAKLQQIVGFRVGKENFGVPIGIVHEIVRMMDITVVPDAPAYIEGVINLRGKIIPVVDLRKRFAERCAARTAATASWSPNSTAIRSAWWSMPPTKCSR